MTSFCRSIFRSSAVLALAVTTAVPAAAVGATGTGSDFAPDLVVSSFRANVVGTQAGDPFSIDLAFEGPRNYYRQFSRFGRGNPLDVQIEQPTFQQFGSGNRARLSFSTIERHPFPAEPDGYSVMDYQLLDGVPSALARHRAGTGMFVPEVLDGMAVLKSTTPVAANDCAGLKATTLTMWLDATTLLPVRATTGAGKQRTTHDVTYSGSNLDVPAKAFARLPARTTQKFDQRFRIASPAAADARLSYVPRMPTFVPAGFVLATTGWAAKSNITGPEASLPRGIGFYSATWRRGVERIDVTQRLGGRDLRRYWLDSDPFAGECMDLDVVDTTVRGVPAKFGMGPTSDPHLFWKEGKLLLTVSGPYPKETLVAIAESMTPIA